MPAPTRPARSSAAGRMTPQGAFRPALKIGDGVRVGATVGVGGMGRATSMVTSSGAAVARKPNASAIATSSR